MAAVKYVTEDGSSSWEDGHLGSKKDRAFEARALVIRAILAYVDDNPGPYDRKRALEAFDRISNEQGLRRASGGAHTGESMLQVLRDVSRRVPWNYQDLFLKGSETLSSQELNTFRYTRVVGANNDDAESTTTESSLSTVPDNFEDFQEHYASRGKISAGENSAPSSKEHPHGQPKRRSSVSDQFHQHTSSKRKREIADTPEQGKIIKLGSGALEELQRVPYEKPSWSPTPLSGVTKELVADIESMQQRTHPDEEGLVKNSSWLPLTKIGPWKDATKMAKTCDLSRVPYLNISGSNHRRFGQTSIKWSEDQIRRCASRITNAIDEVVTFLFQSLNLDYNECYTARLVLLDPDQHLLSLYQIMFNGNREEAWRSTCFEVDHEAAQIDRISASQVVRALLGTYIYQNLIDGSLPWTTGRNLIANMGMDAVWVQSEMERRGVDLQDVMNSAMIGKIEGLLCDDIVLSKAADELADNFRCIISPHLQMLKEISNQPPNQAKSDQWYRILKTEVFREVIKLKTHLEAAREDYYLTWHPRGTHASTGLMGGISKAQESNYQVSMTLFPGIFIHEKTDDGEELRLRSKASVCLESRRCV